jgi:hypothetical protein
MKRAILTSALFFLGFVLISTLALFSSDAEIGSPAPDFTLPGSLGHTHTLSDYAGKIVVLEWLNHGCPFVKKHYNSGNMQALQKMAKEKGVVWFSIISSAPGKQGYSTPEQANEAAQEKNAVPAAILLDPEGTVGKMYGAITTPHMYIIDEEGRLVYNGGIDDIRSANVDDIAKAKNYVRAALEEMLSGQEVSVKTSQPYGCSVKYKN